jgi:hypothetical protein
MATVKGGHLVTINTSSKAAFVGTFANARPELWQNTYGGPWIGAYQDTTAPDYSEPGNGWRWVTGEPWSLQNWMAGEPSNGTPSAPENFAVLANSSGQWLDFLDTTVSPAAAMTWSYIIEYSADCNGDGIVDKGQLLSGQLADTNNNGVPDDCEARPCPGDVTGNNAIDGIDLAAVLAAWGGGKSQFDCDIDDDGTVGGSDLAIVLAGWGACP